MKPKFKPGMEVILSAPDYLPNVKGRGRRGIVTKILGESETGGYLIRVHRFGIVETATYPEDFWMIPPTQLRDKLGRFIS